MPWRSTVHIQSETSIGTLKRSYRSIVHPWVECIRKWKSDYEGAEVKEGLGYLEDHAVLVAQVVHLLAQQFPAVDAAQKDFFHIIQQTVTFQSLQ